MLSESFEYSSRLLKRSYNWDEEKTGKVIQKLVYNYPSHGYVIDYDELKDLGFNVKLFSEEEKRAVEALFNRCLTNRRVNKISPKTTIKLVEFSETSNIQQTSTDALSASSDILSIPTIPDGNSQQTPVHNGV